MTSELEQDHEFETERDKVEDHEQNQNAKNQTVARPPGGSAKIPRGYSRLAVACQAQ